MRRNAELSAIASHFWICEFRAPLATIRERYINPQSAPGGIIMHSSNSLFPTLNSAAAETFRRKSFNGPPGLQQYVD